MDVMPFDDVIDRHESIEQRVSVIRARARWVSVAQPCDTHVAGVRAGRESERANCPFPGAAPLCACHGLCCVAIAVNISATGSQSLGAVLNPE